MATQVEAFLNDGEDLSEGIALVIQDAAIVEYEGALVPAVQLTPWQARCLANALDELADSIEQQQTET